MKCRLLIVTLLALLLLAGCQKEGASPPLSAANEPKSAAAWLPLTIGNIAIEAQIAIEPREKSVGLMDRDSLGPDRGMIFIFPRPQQLSFWMRRTRIPLDIGYFTSDGVLREVYQMQPYDETPVPSARSDLQFALEMNQGWFAQHGVKPGAQLDMTLLKSGIMARGYDTSRLGIR